MPRSRGNGQRAVRVSATPRASRVTNVAEDGASVFFNDDDLAPPHRFSMISSALFSMILEVLCLPNFGEPLASRIPALPAT